MMLISSLMLSATPLQAWFPSGSVPTTYKWLRSEDRHCVLVDAGDSEGRYTGGQSRPLIARASGVDFELYVYASRLKDSSSYLRLS